MADNEEKALRMELAQLRQEHRDLDAAVEALSSAGNSDALQLQRLKKKKLMIKDRIAVLEDQLFPDIIA
ncbi:YdcH family protein [Roseibium sp.]|uniref:YdcH family protein n=1 Tax=Roseibium sp. TaxID=1936156 RepID=UPI003A974C57